MTQFEFLTVAFSILLAVTVTRLVEGLVAEIRSGHAYWVHVLWILQTLMSAAGLWWSIWGFANLEWNYLIFLMVLVGPMLLFTQALALVPREMECLVWKNYFYENVRFFMLVSATTILYLFEVSFLLSDLPLQLRLVLIVMGLGALVFAFVKQQRAHEVYVLVNLLLAASVIMPALMSM